MHIERILLRDVGPFDDVTIEFPKGKNPDLADVYLLTGPNGTGKSTVLYALAAAIGGAELKRILGREFLTERVRSEDTLVSISTDDGQMLATGGFGVNISRYCQDHQLRTLGPVSELLMAWQRVTSTYNYSQAAAAFMERSSEQMKFDWAAFAYAGVRSVFDVRIKAIQAPEVSPFYNSLSFINTSDTVQLANWIVSQNFRRLKAKEAGNDERAERIAQSIRDIELTIGQIVEDPNFGFVFSEEDDDVRIRWNGAVVRLGLLPDGLKSIISWIADLLMRLDRIPWRDNVPVLQRNFLLLLDEVDIHLHPDWQRKVLPFAQRIFPNAQIIASTHSPFVVASIDDAHITTLGLKGSSAVLTHVSNDPQLGVSYSSIVRSIFGITSEFDIDTESKLKQFHAAKQRLLTGDTAAQSEVDELADLLANRSEELREIIALERNQLRRQLAKRAVP